MKHLDQEQYDNLVNVTKEICETLGCAKPQDDEVHSLFFALAVCSGYIKKGSEELNHLKTERLTRLTTFESIITTQIELISKNGYVPNEIHMSEDDFEPFNTEQMLQRGLDSDELQLKQFKGLPIVVHKDVRSINNRNLGGWTFPVQVTMRRGERSTDNIGEIEVELRLMKNPHHDHSGDQDAPNSGSGR